MEQITDDEYNLIVEALLFGSCLEITDNWSEHNRASMFDIALKLKQKTTSLNNLQIHRLLNEQPIISEGLSVDSVIKEFPNISIVDYND